MQLKLFVVKWSKHIIPELAKRDPFSYIEVKKRRVANSRVTMCFCRKIARLKYLHNKDHVTVCFTRSQV